MTIPPEMIEATARAMCENGGFDPDERMANGGPRWGYYVPGATAAIRTLAPMMAEVFAGVIDTHKPDASFDDSGAGALERNALLDNVAAEVRAKGKEMADG